MGASRGLASRSGWLSPFLDGNRSGSFVPDVNRAIKPLLYRDFGPGDADGAGIGLELVDLSLVADGVVVGDLAGSLGTQNGAQVEAFRDRSEGGVGVPWFHPEVFGILGYEYPVEVVVSFGRVGDVVMVEFCDQPVLERLVDTLTPAPGLRAVGEDELDGERLHGNLEVGGLIVALQDMGAAVAGSSELTGSVEVEGLR